MPEPVEDCVDSILNDNPDMDESKAYAICNAQNKGDNAALAQALKDAGAEDWIGTVQKLVSQGVETDVLVSVVQKATSGLYADEPNVRKSLAKSDQIRKVGFDAEVTSQATIFKADGDFVVWGPASVEVVDKEGDRIKAKALEAALPQLLKRARLSLEHSDQLVGRILERFDTDEPVTVEVGGKTYERSDFPTDVLELDGMEPALYVAGEIYDDTRQAQETRKRIENGELDSYSISGEALVTRKKISDGEAHDDIVDMDLSAVTICEQGMNQKAKFGVVSDSDTGIETKTTRSATAKGNDANGSSRGPSVDAVGTVAATAINKTMSQDNDGDSQGGFNMEDLQTEFKSVLDSKLPEGELATKDDMREVAREVYRQENEEEEEEEVPPEMREGGEEEEEEEGYEEKQVPEALGMLQDKYPNLTEEKLRSMLESMEGGNGGNGGGSGGSGGNGNGGNGGSGGNGGGGSQPPENKAECPVCGGDHPAEECPEREEKEDRAGQEGGRDASDEGQSEEYEDREDPIETDDEGVPETRTHEEKQAGYDAAELEEVLPGDVWEVVREYLDDGEEMAGEEEMGGMEEEEEQPAVDIEAADDATIEAAVEKVLKGKGLNKASGADAPTGNAEKSYDESAESGSSHGGNPALANFYED